jgi:hypothetical protein
MNLLMTTLGAMITSAGFWGVLQLIITRKGRTAEVARQKAETEKTQQEAASGEINRQKILAEAQVVSQEAALRSADVRYAGLRTDYDELKVQSKEQRAIIATLVEIMDTLVFRMRTAAGDDERIVVSVTAQEFLAARAALSEARTHLR